VEPRTQRRTHGRRNRRPVLRARAERVAQAAAEPCARKQDAQTLRGASKAIAEGSFDPVGGLLLRGRALPLAIGLGKGRCPRLFGVAEMPDRAATDAGRQIPLLRKTGAVFFVGQALDGQREPTPGEYADQTLLPQGPHQTIERPGGARGDHGPQRHTEPARRGQESVAGPRRAPLAIA
jgi:hypothetical protein